MYSVTTYYHKCMLLRSVCFSFAYVVAPFVRCCLVAVYVASLTLATDPFLPLPLFYSSRSLSLVTDVKLFLSGAGYLHERLR